MAETERWIPAAEYHAAAALEERAAVRRERAELLTPAELAELLTETAAELTLAAERAAAGGWRPAALLTWAETEGRPGALAEAAEAAEQLAAALGDCTEEPPAARILAAALTERAITLR